MLKANLKSEGCGLQFTPLSLQVIKDPEKNRQREECPPQVRGAAIEGSTEIRGPSKLIEEVTAQEPCSSDVVCCLFLDVDSGNGGPWSEA